MNMTNSGRGVKVIAKGQPFLKIAFHCHVFLFYVNKILWLINISKAFIPRVGLNWQITK